MVFELFFKIWLNVLYFLCMFVMKCLVFLGRFIMVCKFIIFVDVLVIFLKVLDNNFKYLIFVFIFFLFFFISN